jgi:hypothetical protein
MNTYPGVSRIHLQRWRHTLLRKAWDLCLEFPIAYVNIVLFNIDTSMKNIVNQIASAKLRPGPINLFWAFAHR